MDLTAKMWLVGIENRMEIEIQRLFVHCGTKSKWGFWRFSGVEKCSSICSFKVCSV